MKSYEYQSSQGQRRDPVNKSSTKYLDDAFRDRINALGTVRICLAFTVVLSHSFLVLGNYTDFTQSIGAWAVNGFFALSGYLIASSRMRLPFGKFLWHRALRLLPAYWAVLILVAFIVAPLSTIATDESWDPLSSFSYVLKNVALWVAQPGIKSTIQFLPHSDDWNAPLWTLAHEGGAYIVAGLILSISFVRRRSVFWLGLGLVTLTISLVMVQTTAIPWVPISIEKGLRLGSFFVAGMLLHALRRRLPLRWWWAASCVALLTIFQWAGISGWVGQFFFAYLILWIGASVPLRIGVRNDLSYGVYIWAFPIQQLLVAFGIAQTLGTIGSLSLALALTLPIAWLSWRLIERPALSLKSIGSSH